MFNKEKIILILTSILIALIPFLWMSPGQVDIGGDASRLYFIDPLSYLRNFSLYFVVPQGTGIIEPSFFSIPFILLLYLLKQILIFPYLLITLFNSFKLVAAFLSMYFILKELSTNFNLIKSTRLYAPLLIGLFYIFTPTMTGNWDRALFSHNQVFINPLIFLMLLRFVNTNRSIYLWWVLLISFIFSNSFSYTSAPPFFAFFPLAIIFLLVYAFIFRKKFSYKKILFSFILFLGLQAFHLIPQIVNFLDPGSYINTRVFDKATIAHEGVRYFTSILSISRLSNYILLSYGPQVQFLTTPIPSLLILVGFLINMKIRRIMLMTSIFYLLTLFLLSGKITTFGSETYKLLFYLPGFSMFRNFIGQWLFAFSFFNALLLGFALVALFEKIKPRFRFSLFCMVLVVLIFASINFIFGKNTNKTLFHKSNTRIAQELDENFLKTLAFIKDLPTESKILVFPFTDAYYQVVPGENNQGVYIGPSAFSYLAGKADFVGYQVIEPFGDEFLNLSKNKNFNGLNSLFSILNINYVVHNSSPFVLDNNNEDFLYENVRDYLPNNQNAYKKFIENLGAKKIAQFGYYNIYELQNTKNYSHVYIPSNIIASKPIADTSGLISKVDITEKKVFIYESDCKIVQCSNLKLNTPKIQTKKINPTKYKIHLENITGKFMLVFSDSYHRAWKLYFDSREINPQNHFITNYYSNGWLINPKSINKQTSVDLVLELELQKIFYISSIITFISLAILMFWGYNILRNE